MTRRRQIAKADRLPPPRIAGRMSEHEASAEAPDEDAADDRLRKVAARADEDPEDEAPTSKAAARAAADPWEEAIAAFDVERSTEGDPVTGAEDIEDDEGVEPLYDEDDAPTYPSAPASPVSELWKPPPRNPLLKLKKKPPKPPVPPGFKNRADYDRLIRSSAWSLDDLRLSSEKRKQLAADLVSRYGRQIPKAVGAELLHREREREPFRFRGTGPRYPQRSGTVLNHGTVQSAARFTKEVKPPTRRSPPRSFIIVVPAAADIVLTGAHVWCQDQDQVREAKRKAEERQAAEDAGLLPFTRWLPRAAVAGMINQRHQRPVDTPLTDKQLRGGFWAWAEQYLDETLELPAEGAPREIPKPRERPARAPGTIEFTRWLPVSRVADAMSRLYRRPTGTKKQLRAAFWAGIEQGLEEWCERAAKERRGADL